MPNFSHTFHQSGDVLVVACRGPIDENAVLPSLHQAKTGKVQINLKDVDYINSAGIAIWMTWLRTCFTKDPKLRITLLSCPKIIMDQVNTLVNFCPPGVIIDSLYVPFYCESCDIIESVMFQKGSGYSYDTGEVSAHKVPCPKCGKSMVMDVLPKKYFSFLKRAAW